MISHDEDLDPAYSCEKEHYRVRPAERWITVALLLAVFAIWVIGLGAAIRWLWHLAGRVFA